MQIQHIIHKHTKREKTYTEGPRLTHFLGLGKTVLHETCVSGTVLWSPTNANSPTYTYISQKNVLVETVLVIFV